MSETRRTELHNRRTVEPPSEPDENGMIAVEAFETTYADHLLVTDIDENPLCVVTEYRTARSVHRVPPNSVTLQRLHEEGEVRA